MATESSAPSATWFWGCLVPATACAMFLLMAASPGSNLSQRHVMTAVLSNQNYAAYAFGTGQTPENHLAAVTFDWTNRGGISSSIGFTPTTNLSN